MVFASARNAVSHRRLSYSTHVPRVICRTAPILTPPGWRTGLGQKQKLPRRSIAVGFTSISRHYARTRSSVPVPGVSHSTGMPRQRSVAPPIPHP